MPGRNKTQSSALRDRETWGQAVAAAVVVLTVTVVLWLVAPLVEGSAFWQEHFVWAHPREPLPFFGGFLLAGIIGGALWPGTWESTLLERSLRALGWTILLYWLLAVVLEAPAAAGVAVLPILGAPAFTAFRVARQAPEGSVRPYVAALFSVAGALALVLLAVVDFEWVTRFILLPIPVALYGLGPVVVLRDVRERHMSVERARRPTVERPREETRFFLDLPPGTLRPAATALGVLGTVATVAFLVTVVSPGVPLSGPIAWVSLTLSLPIVVWSVLRREGVAHPQRVIAPLNATLHHARVEHVRDRDLERLDDALLRFIRTGRGRTDLAHALSTVFAASVPQGDPETLDSLLGRLPRTPWRHRAREDGLAHLLGGTGILKQVREARR